MARKISRKSFLKGSAAMLVSVTALAACSNNTGASSAASASTPADSSAASSGAAKPAAKVDGKYVTKAMGHENYVYVSTTIREGVITECKVLRHDETMGIGNFACARIPARIVEHQSVNVPNVRGCSISSQAIKSAVTLAIEEAGYDINDFNKEIPEATETGTEELSCDVVVVGAGTAGLVAAVKLLEEGKSVVLVEKNDIPGGTMPMVYGGFFSPDSQLQKNFDLSGTQTYTPEQYVGFFSHQMNPEYDRFDGKMPYDIAVYSKAGELVDWLHGMGVGFSSLGTYEQGTTYGVSPYLAPGCYKGGAGYMAMFLANRVEAYGSSILYSTAVDSFLMTDGVVSGVHAKARSGKEYNITAKRTLLACGGFARNAEYLKQYHPTYADQFFNCCSASTGDMIAPCLELGGYMECTEDREMPAFLSSFASKFELAFIHYSAPGIIVNEYGDSIGNFISDNHYSMGRAKMNKEVNGSKLFYIMDDASAEMCKDSESYGFDTYKALFDKGEAVHYDSVAACAEELNLPGLQDAIDANNAAALSGEPDEFGRSNCPFIETRNGIWAVRVDPTFYLTTAGLAIDTQGHLLKEDGSIIPNVYCAGDVAGSVEEKDGKTYGCGFICATTFGLICAEEIAKEI